MVKILKIGLFVVGALVMTVSVGEAQDFYRARQNMGSKPIYGNMQTMAWKQVALRKMGPWQARAYWTGMIADNDRDMKGSGRGPQMDRERGPQSEGDRRRGPQMDRERGPQTEGDRRRGPQMERERGPKNEGDRRRGPQMDRERGPQPEADRRRGPQMERERGPQPEDIRRPGTQNSRASGR
ncbi:MAG: hypothetical protein VYC80_15240, partial [Planctomycetota bacterium]|nr:hypothetical protein [Planctomycetota bacterium]